MEIKKSHLFKIQLQNILEHIAKDKIIAMQNFRKELNILINDLPNIPYKYRKSYYCDDEKVRDMIYKGYTVIYKIYDDYILMVEIFNHNLPVIPNTIQSIQ